jgi:hypothetical protein
MPGHDISNLSQGIWTPYTPTWTATSDPAIGNGTIDAAYILIEKLLQIRIAIVMGSTTTYGSGNWNLSLPLGLTSKFHQMGTGGAHDVGVRFDPANPYFEDGNNTFTIVTTGTGRLDFDTPFTWNTSDRLILFGALEVD